MSRWSRGSLALVVLVVACGKAKDTPAPSEPPTGSGVGSGSAVAPAPPVPPPPVPPPPPAMKPTVTLARDLADDTAINVAEFGRIAKQWLEGGEVTFVGYAALYVGDSEELRTSLVLAGQPGQKEEQGTLICDLAASEAGKHVDNQTLLTFKGKVRGLWGAHDEQMWITDCVLIAQGVPAQDDAVPIAGQPAPVAVDQLTGAYLGWKGKQVSVTGAYFGSTISRKGPKDDTIIDVRIDLLTAIGTMEPKVGCHLAKVEPAPALVTFMDQHRAAVTVTGTLVRGLASGAQLDPCKVLY